MKTVFLTSIIAALSVSTAMAASVANFTNATEQTNPHAASNAQVAKQIVALEQVNQGMLNPKVVNPVFQYTGASTPSNVEVQANTVRVDH